MAAGAARWVWVNSRATNSSLIVLLAIADEADKDGFAAMSVIELARKARISERAVQIAARELERLSELSVTPRGGDHGRNGYRLRMDRGADSAPLPDSSPADSAPLGPAPQILHPADSAPLARHPPSSQPRGAESAPQQISNGVLKATGSPMAEVKPSPAKPPKQDDPPRPDIERLCSHLAGRIEANGSKRPAITRKWRDSCRLMIDNDGRTEQQIMAAIDWCQDDEFWRANILSMPKLREKYDTLRMRAMQSRKNPRNSRQPDESLFDDARQLARALDEQEAGHDPRGNGHPHPVHPRALPPAGG